MDAAGLDHLKEEVNSHFISVTSSQIQDIHRKSPKKVAPVSTNHLAKLSGFIEELLDKFEPAQVSKLFRCRIIVIPYVLIHSQRLTFGRADLSYTLPSGDTEAVFAFRYENVNKPLTFSKKEFVNSVAFGQLGVTNRRKQIGTSRDKCTLIFLRCLS